MGKYRTAQGKVLDMNSLIAKNEKVRAVGNMKVNARGDTIDGAGRVVRPVTQKVNDNYAKTVGNRSARAKKNTATTGTHADIVDPSISSKELEELAGFDEGAEEVIQLKEKESKRK